MRLLLNMCIALSSLSALAAEPAVPPSEATSPGYQLHKGDAGFNPVDAELAALRERKDVVFSVQSGWTIVTSEDGLTIWSFAPTDHPAHPAFAKRWVFQKGGAWYQDMNVMCGAPKPVCDKFFQDFVALNNQLRESLKKNKGR